MIDSQLLHTLDPLLLTFSRHVGLVFRDCRELSVESLNRQNRDLSNTDRGLARAHSDAGSRAASCPPELESSREISTEEWLPPAFFSEDRHRDLHALLHAFARIPYENLTKIISVHERATKIVKHTPEDVIAGFITHGTGGTCFPLTLTLRRFIQSLGYSCFPILADRRYGVDTHCALICETTPNTWSLIDPGYLITRPCPISHAETTRCILPLTTIELRPILGTHLVSLHTAIGGNAQEGDLKYRLTYKVAPVDDETFHRAWDRSFDWEMMTYPIVSTLKDDTQIYLQKTI